MPYIPMLHENNVRKGIFEHSDFLAFRDALLDCMKGFVTFGYKTGWRFSEITDPTWERVDRKEGIVRLEPGETKNQDGRTLFMDAELLEAINKQWEIRKRSGKLGLLVFPGRDGKSLIGDYRD
jgi:integrase